MSSQKFDLLSTVVYGGCSAKIPAGKLSELLSDLPLMKSQNIMVDIETHDDAGVFRINDTTALVVTTDFFPPICSDAREFGQIAAANSLSDVYAMGGTPLLVLNLNMFPASKISLDVLHDILLGGQEKINEAGAFTMGGHTIEDDIPKYGLAVVGTVHPDNLITNSGVKEGQLLVLTKPLGTGVLTAAHRMKIAPEESYKMALSQMKLLNKFGCEMMIKYGVRGATDITGFGLLGHAVKMAQASGVSLQIESMEIPVIPYVEELIDQGCIPGAAMRNLEFATEHIHVAASVSVFGKMICCDAQTSGGLLMAIDEDKCTAMLKEIEESGIHPFAKVIGRVLPQRIKSIYLI